MEPVLTLFWNAPWSAVSSRTVGALIEAGATSSFRDRRVSLYDLVCNLGDTHAMQAQREHAADPVTRDCLDDELDDLHTEHYRIRRAFARLLDVPHHHYA
ncbi:hypothetical protein ACIOG4_37450 [Streptomyces microflavus]|uniref:hypothetical protein n=1 Tax=Streptomyces microflavus TaxID=1919 RepID=UPI0038258848